MHNSIISMITAVSLTADLNMFPKICFFVLFSAVLISRVFSYIDTYPTVVKNATTKPLFIALILSFGGGYNSSHVIPAVQLALNRINQDPQMLPGYTLHYTLTDSQCNNSVALKGFFQQIVPGPTKVAVIGAGCSVATEPVASISHFYNITHLSCASSSSTLANRIRFKSYFQLVPTDNLLSPAFVALSKEYQWRRITIIRQNENLFSRLVDQMLITFSKMNISWILQDFDSSKGVISLGDTIFDSENRITFLAMYSDHARQYICEAFKRGLHYPQYVFIVYGWYRYQWWYPSKDDNITCNITQMEQVLDRSLLVTQYPEILNQSEITDTGEDYDTFRMNLDSLLNTTDFEYMNTVDHCYDATWTLAKALNNTISDLQSNATLNMLAAQAEKTNNTEFTMEDFTYKNSIVEGIMFRNLEQTNFTGITGQVTFDSLGIRTVNRLRITQYQRDSDMMLNRVEIASVFEGEKGFQYRDGANSSNVWLGSFPYDGVAENVTISVHVAVTVSYTLLIVVGIAFAIICLLFNIIFRNSRLIRLSSSSLNYVIIAGASIMYFSIILYILPVVDQMATTILCNIRPRLLSLGYCLCFGTILAKMWRVYYIFTNPTPNRKGIRNWHLGLFVAILVLIDVVLFGVVAALPFARDPAPLVPNEEYLSEETGILRCRTDFYIYTCNQRSNYTLSGVLFGYIALLQVAAIFLAFGTRKVKVKGLNDSLYIAAIIYITSILWVAIILVSVLLNNRANTYSVLLATIIFISASVVLGLVFVPKMVWLYKDPKGTNVFSSTQNGQQQPPSTALVQFSSNTVDSILSDKSTTDSKKIEILAARVRELEANGKRLKSAVTNDTVAGRASVDTTLN